MPPELPALRSACTRFLDLLAGVEPGLEQLADINRIQDPRWSELLDQLRAASRPFGLGTPAAISRVVSELLGEA